MIDRLSGPKLNNNNSVIDLAKLQEIDHFLMARIFFGGFSVAVKN
jgi:hypothetical protein